MVTRAADDYAEIRKVVEARRIARITQEVAGAGCECPDDEREDGTIVKVHQIGCVHFVATSGPSGFVLPPQQQPQRIPDDDWRALKEQAQSIEAAFLRRLHLRIESARPRSFWAPK